MSPLAFVFLISCSSKDNTAGIALSKAVSFQKLDRIQIHFLGIPAVHDLDPITGTVLFMEHGEFQRLAKAYGDRGTISKVLNYRQSLSLTMIRRFSQLLNY